MGIGPAPASQKLLKRLGLIITDMDVIELNEAFAAQGLAVLRQLGLPADAEPVNPNGRAIAPAPPRPAHRRAGHHCLSQRPSPWSPSPYQNNTPHPHPTPSPPPPPPPPPPP